MPRTSIKSYFRKIKALQLLKVLWGLNVLLYIIVMHNMACSSASEFQASQVSARKAPAIPVEASGKAQEENQVMADNKADVDAAMVYENEAPVKPGQIIGSFLVCFRLIAAEELSPIASVACRFEDADGRRVAVNGSDASISYRILNEALEGVQVEIASLTRNPRAYESIVTIRGDDVALVNEVAQQIRVEAAVLEAGSNMLMQSGDVRLEIPVAALYRWHRNDVAGDLSVLDLNTSLNWLTPAAGSCEDLIHGGLSDWRLPSLHELRLAAQHSLWSDRGRLDFPFLNLDAANYGSAEGISFTPDANGNAALGEALAGEAIDLICVHD